MVELVAAADGRVRYEGHGSISEPRQNHLACLPFCLHICWVWGHAAGGPLGHSALEFCGASDMAVFADGCGLVQSNLLAYFSLQEWLGST